MNNMIELNKISKNYKTKNTISVLKSINYKFKQGKIYSIIGPSGSGKSTLLNLLSLIDRPSKGKIIIDSNEINFKNKINNDILRAKKIGIIYQDKNLLSDFTALENVYLARLSLDDDKLKAIQDAKKIIKKVGLTKRINHYPSELSGGESQRIAICRALINSPEIILADEPTGNLDHKNSKEIFKILMKLSNKKRTIIFATHNRYFANLADCKIELIDGKIKVINGKRRK
tara:strand:+ start:510 stop:1199 length:690 start_codon:yes stop_codon:yes gene_type:complete